MQLLYAQKSIPINHTAFSSHSSEQYLVSGLVTNLPHCEHVEYMVIVLVDHKKTYFDRN